MSKNIHAKVSLFFVSEQTILNTQAIGFYGNYPDIKYKTVSKVGESHMKPWSSMKDGYTGKLCNNTTLLLFYESAPGRFDIISRFRTALPLLPKGRNAICCRTSLWKMTRIIGNRAYCKSYQQIACALLQSMWHILYLVAREKMRKKYTQSIFHSFTTQDWSFYVHHFPQIYYTYINLDLSLNDVIKDVPFTYQNL